MKKSKKSSQSTLSRGDNLQGVEGCISRDDESKRTLTDNDIKLITSSPASLAEYISNGKWQRARHLAYINEILIKFASGKDKHLILNMPPRHGKSELVSVWFPFWYLGLNPDKNIILTTYGQSLSNLFGRKVLSIIKEHGKNIFDIEINPSLKSAANFGLIGRLGSMLATGVGGAITGKGADLFIIDDPVKNQTDAMSRGARDRLWEWFKSTAYTRLEPGGNMIIAMTRWHEEDLCGRIIGSNRILLPDGSLYNPPFEDGHRVYDEKIPSFAKMESLDDIDDEYDDWHLISLPAIAENDDLLRREPRTPLWVERYPMKKLMRNKKLLGSYWFNAMYQQSPVPDGGNVFKRETFKYFEVYEESYILLNGKQYDTVPKRRCSIYAACDLAMETKETADYTAIVVFALAPENRILILDVIRQKFDSTVLLQLLHSVDEKWSPAVIGIEKAQIGSTLIKNAIDDGLIAKELKPDKGKVMRALPMAALMEGGAVYFSKNDHWLDAFETELLSFPNGRHDDQVDAFSYIVQMLHISTGVGVVSAGKRRLPDCLITERYQ